MNKKKIQLGVSFVASFLLLMVIANLRYNAINTSGEVQKGTQVIVLDAGHGGLDSGCVGVSGVLEKGINLAIVKNLQSLLEISGYKVVLTRSEDVSIHNEGVTGTRNQKVSDMENRLKIVKKYPNSIFFSIHQNQFTASEYFGGQMFYTTKNKENYKLAGIMQRCFAELQPGNNRETKLEEKGLYLFKDTMQPALLIECGFLSNKSDEALLSNEDYQKKVAFTIYKGIMQYMEECNKGSSTNGEDTLRMQ